jgi:hypothetical protein
MTKSPKRRSPKKPPPELRMDVTRLEYRRLLEDVARNAEAIKRLETAHEIQFRRTAELQAELDALRNANPRK